MADQERVGGLLPGRGLLHVRDFCLNTGLDADTVGELMRSGRLAGACFAEDGRPFGIMDDELPTKEELLAMGLTVRDEWNPDGPFDYAPIGPEGP